MLMHTIFVYQNLESSSCNYGGNRTNSAFKLKNCLLCALIFEKKLKFFIKFTFFKFLKFLLLKKWGAQLIRGHGVFEKIRYLAVVGFQVLTVVRMRMAVFWVAALCSLVKVY
jgi:hypothetical protein